MKAEDLQKLKQILFSFDEAGLVALANKGLVRRAQKDRAECGTLQVEELDDQLLVRGPDWTVWMPISGPARARDSTRATGVTRQILTATIYLREYFQALDEASQRTNLTSSSATKVSTAATTEVVSCTDGQLLAEALLQLTLDDVTRWAGKTVSRQAIVLTKNPIELEVRYDVGLRLKLAEFDVEVHFLPPVEKGPRLLEQALSTAPKSMHKHWVAVAILTLIQQSGKTFSTARDLAVSDFQRWQGVLYQTNRLLESILTVGIAHPSARIVERLSTLAMSATAAQLPRLANMLRALSDNVSHLLLRDTAGDTDRVLAGMSWIYALVRALETGKNAAPQELVGSVRTQYDSLPDLTLSGLGAYPWQTASGFEGLSVLFWDLDHERFLTWSTTRSTNTTDTLNAMQYYKYEAPWHGGKTTEQLSRTTFTLKNPRLNALNRLSSSQQSSVCDNALQTTPAQINFGNRLFADWMRLQAYVAEQYPIGLRLGQPSDRIVILEPSRWGERFFDELQQAFCWQIHDCNESSLLLTVRWNRMNETIVQFLEAVKPARESIKRVSVRIVVSHSGFTLEPLSFFTQGANVATVLNPAFDLNLITSQQSELLLRLRKKFGRVNVQTVMIADDEWEETLSGSAAIETLPVKLRQALAETSMLLLNLAESGTQQLQPRTQQQILALADRLKRCGMSHLGESMQALITDDAQQLAPRVLWADYLCRVHWQALASRQCQLQRR